MEYGNIKLEQDKNEYRIDVTAESGTVRTYIIKLKNTEKTSNDLEIEEIENIVEEEKTESDDEEQNSLETNNKTYNYKLIYISTGTTIALIIITCIIIKFKMKKGKHDK